MFALVLYFLYSPDRHVITITYYYGQVYCNVNIKLLHLTEKFHVMGIKINTPHYLAKLENVQRGVSSYTIIVSQLESLSTIYYTLRVSN